MDRILLFKLRVLSLVSMASFILSVLSAGIQRTGHWFLSVLCVFRCAENAKCGTGDSSL